MQRSTSASWIARAISTEPAVLLMDEPCSALDPIATRRIEELMVELKQNYTIALVTHNMQQALRVADTTAFFSVDISKGIGTGHLVEMGTTRQIFEQPREQLTRAPGVERRCRLVEDQQPGRAADIEKSDRDLDHLPLRD